MRFYGDDVEYAGRSETESDDHSLNDLLCCVYYPLMDDEDESRCRKSDKMSAETLLGIRASVKEAGRSRVNDHGCTYTEDTESKMGRCGALKSDVLHHLR